MVSGIAGVVVRMGDAHSGMIGRDAETIVKMLRDVLQAQHRFGLYLMEV
jgi:hypothetical protein